jgi:ribosome-associated toxin RatA of RatAB toxin-antitoxin module
LVGIEALREETLHTENRIFIRARASDVYRFAASVERWPEILPHYRWVRILEEKGDRRLVEMAASRDGIPVRWRAKQELFPEEPRITFRHVGGVTKGMEVEWLFEPAGDGAVRVAILHDLHLGWPLIGGLVAERIIGPFFVSNIAGKTLNRMKELAEGTTRADGRTGEEPR